MLATLRKKSSYLEFIVTTNDNNQETKIGGEKEIKSNSNSAYIVRENMARGRSLGTVYVHNVIDGHTKVVPAGQQKNLIIFDVIVDNLD